MLNFKNLRMPQYNPFHSTMTIYGTKLQLKLINEMIENNIVNRKGPLPNYKENNYDIHAVETVILLMKTFELYKDEVEDAQEILEFATKYVKTGILNGLPYINSIDKNMHIIHEVMEFINEVRSEFYSTTFFDEGKCYNTYISDMTFDSFIKSKDDNKQQELYYLYNSNINEYDKFSNDQSIEVLEYLLEDYEKNRDTIFYKLENVKYYPENLLRDPLLDISKSYMSDYAPSGENINRIRMACNKNLIEFGLYLSYEFPSITIEIVNINKDYEIKKYKFIDGEYIKEKLRRSDKVEIIYDRITHGYDIRPSDEWDRRTETYKKPSLTGVTNSYLLDMLEIMKVNIGKLRIQDTVTIPVSDKPKYVVYPIREIIDKLNKCYIIDLYHGHPVINPLISAHSFNSRETMLYLILSSALRSYNIKRDHKIYEIIKTDNMKLFKNKQTKKKLFVKKDK